MPAYDIDPYSILGVAPDASADDIKAAYRRAARRLHPDNNRSPGAGVQFQDVTIAYELLSDDARRRNYDEYARTQNEGIYFNFRVTPSRRTIALLPEPQVFYLLAEIIPDIRAKDSQYIRESRLNLTLVLDRSNSMNGTRMDKVKVAAYQIIDQLTSDDIISIVSFNDFADIVVPATTVTDKAALKARVSMILPSGGTEIHTGLEMGIEQNRKFLAPRMVNHIILLTDGNTFTDESATVQMAKDASKDGISISAMGLGQEWNDRFLDDIASATGGTSSYINSSSAVVKFMNDHVRSLANVFAERVHISVAADPDVRVESMFKLSPSPQPLNAEQGNVPLGSLQVNRIISTIIQLEMPPVDKPGFRTIARLVAEGEIFTNSMQKYQAISDISLNMAEDPPPEEPPTSILDALGKLTLYRMQERAQAMLEKGEVKEATRLFENLATRLLELGESNLAAQALAEAQQVAYTNSLSDKGRKAIKYQTRHLMLPTAEEAV